MELVDDFGNVAPSLPRVPGTLPVNDVERDLGSLGWAYFGQLSMDACSWTCALNGGVNLRRRLTAHHFCRGSLGVPIAFAQASLSARALLLWSRIRRRASPEPCPCAEQTLAHPVDVGFDSEERINNAILSLRCPPFSSSTACPRCWIWWCTGMKESSSPVGVRSRREKQWAVALRAEKSCRKTCCQIYVSTTLA